LGKMQVPLGDPEFATDLRLLVPEIGVEALDIPHLPFPPVGQFSLANLKTVHLEAEDILNIRWNEKETENPPPRPSSRDPNPLREIDDRTQEDHIPEGRHPSEEATEIRVKPNTTNLRKKGGPLGVADTDPTELKKGEERAQPHLPDLDLLLKPPTEHGLKAGPEVLLNPLG
jgi:hypothetical protein